MSIGRHYRSLPLIAAALLAGCGTTGPKVIRTPVTAPCFKKSDVPPVTPPIAGLSRDARIAADQLAEKLLEVRDENGLLRAAYKACPGE